MELYALQEVVSEFEQANATLVALSPQLEEHNHSMVENHDLAFDILTDPGNEYAAKLGLRFEIPDNIAEIYRGFGINLPECNGEDSWTLPMPGRIVVSQDGIVRATDIDPDYTARPEPAATVAEVRAL
ncbi:MAG: redoxin domain-containing protein [Gammaproteobacteria bacterium]